MSDLPSNRAQNTMPSPAEASGSAKVEQGSALERFPIERNRSIDQNSLERKNSRALSDPIGSDSALVVCFTEIVGVSRASLKARGPSAALDREPSGSLFQPIKSAEARY
jgi:hypothetical protein